MSKQYPNMKPEVAELLAKFRQAGKTDFRCIDPDCQCLTTRDATWIRRNGHPICCGMTMREEASNE